MKKILGILVMLMPFVVWGQKHTDTIDLNQVVVTATQHASTRTEVPAVVGVVSHERLDAVSAVNLAEGLRFETGVRVENTCQNCGANEVRINGLGGAYSQVLIDSRPINSALAGVYLLEQLPTTMIERVEVLRGGGSSLYGSNAIAGVINVITREPVGNTASVGNTTHLEGMRTADWSNSFNASVVSDNRKAGLFVFGHNRQRDPYDHNGDGYSELGLLKARMVGFRGYVRPSDYTKLNIEYHNLNEFRRGGDRFDLPSPMAHISEGGEHDIHSGSLKWDWFSSSGLRHASLFASAQHVNRQSYYGEREDGDPYGTAYGYTTDLTLNYGALYSRHYDRLWFMPADLTAGVEHTLDKLSDRNLNSNDTLRQQVGVLSAYLQNEWKSYRWSLLLGARADKHTLVEQPVVSPRVNVRYAPSEHLVLRAGYSSGFRAPQVYDEDLHVGAVNGELYKITNATDLRMETSHSLTASADLCFHLGAVEADLLLEAFFTRINDAFVNELLFDDTLSGYRHYERRNADGAEVKGLNAELRLTPHRTLQLQLGGTWQSSRYTGVGQEWSEGCFEQRMERTPDLYAYLTGLYSPTKRLQLTASGTFTGPMLVYHNVGDGVEQVVTPSFLDLSLKAAYSIPFGRRAALELSAGVQNLFNSYQQDLEVGPERDSQYVYGPSQPRTLFVGAKLTL
ncbi:MAG: TonB-dependent receptor [Bacteroidales bacterium]|nr:TonB-dependent receptor [Bacteroidales bacterium]